MKNLFRVKWVIVAVVIAMIFGLGACAEDEGLSDPLFESYRDSSIKISNYTKTDIVAFKGSLDSGTIIGGIPAGSTNHGIKNDPKHFPTNPTQFRVLFITKDQYNKNKNNLSALNNQIFTQIYIFWNGTSGDNSKVYEISGRLGGEYTLQIWNPGQQFNVEFRVGGTAGETLGFAQSGMAQTNLYVGEGDYLIYPVFQRINTIKDIVETVIPRRASGNAFFYEFNFGEDPAVKTLSLSLQQATGAMTQMSAGASYLLINNGSETGVRFERGSIPQFTPGGFSTINSGAHRYFLIDMPKAPGGNHEPSITVGNLWIRSGGFETRIVNQNDEHTFILETDKTYTVNVSGVGGEADFKAVVNTSVATDLVPEEVPAY